MVTEEDILVCTSPVPRFIITGSDFALDVLSLVSNVQTNNLRSLLSTSPQNKYGFHKQLIVDMMQCDARSDEHR